MCQCERHVLCYGIHLWINTENIGSNRFNLQFDLTHNQWALKRAFPNGFSCESRSNFFLIILCEAYQRIRAHSSCYHFRMFSEFIRIQHHRKKLLLSLQASDDSVEEHAFDDIKNLMRVSNFQLASFLKFLCLTKRKRKKKIGSAFLLALGAVITFVCSQSRWLMRQDTSDKCIIN